MNVQVLGDDVCYGASLKTVFRKQQAQLHPEYSQYRQDDEHLGGGFTDALVGIGKGIAKVFTSDTGKAVTSAVLTASAGRLTPTDKANLASVQQAAGISPQVVTGGGVSLIKWPSAAGDQLTSAMPLILGGVALLGVMLVMMKQRA